MAVITGQGMGGTRNPYEQLAKNLNKQGAVSNTVQSSVQAGQASSNPGFVLGMGMGAQSAANNAAKSSGLPGVTGTGSMISGSNSGGSSTYSNTPTAARAAGTQTTYIDPNGQQQTGWIINGQTYKDQSGNNRVDVGSKVQTGGGWYQLGSDGKGVAIADPTKGGSTSGGSSGGSYGGGSSTNNGTPQKPITVQYYDPSGRQQIGYMINGQTYIDQAGTQRIGTGSMVQTANGWYQLGADGKGVQVAAPKQTTYTDEYGDKHTAWILGTGQSYLDPQGINRIPVGSVVETANGKYLMTESGGVPITDAELRQRQQNNLFAQRQQSMIDAVNAATDAGVLGYQQMLPGINAQYDSAAKQAYSNYMLERQDMPEQMARLGLGGQGVTESTAAKMANTYQGNLNESELARRAAIQQVNNDIAKLKADAQTQIAQGKFDLSGEQFDAYRWLQELMMQKEQNQWQQDSWQKEHDLTASSSEFEQKLAIAAQLAQYGDFSGYKALGYDTTQMEKEWKRQQDMEAYQVYSSDRSAGSSRGSGGSGSSKSGSDGGKIAYSKALADMKSADNPYQRYDELLATYDISSTDAERLKKELDGMFDEEMDAIKAGRITYESIRDDPDGRHNTNRWRLMFGDEGYQELLAAAFDMYQKRKGTKR